MRKLITSVAIAAAVAVAGVGMTSNAAFAGGGHHHKHKHHHKHHKHHKHYGYWGWGFGGLATGLALGFAYNAYAQPQQPTVQYVPTPVYPAQPAYVYDPYTGQYVPVAPAYFTPAPVTVP